MLSRSYKKSLENSEYHKLIIGASLKDLSRIADYAYCFTYAKADVIDISAFPHSLIAAQDGIHRAKAEMKLAANEMPLIMLSVNIDEDPHFRRITVDIDKCTKCQLCIPSCPSKAFSDLNIFSYEADLCFGCSNCLEYCPFEALSFENWSAYDAGELNRLFSLGAEAFEIHLSNNLEALSAFYQQLNLENILLESFSIGSERMSEAELTRAALFIVEMVSQRKDFAKRSIIIQCDGIPQSGARIADEDKDLKSIQNAALVIKALNEAQLGYPNIFVQIAGGINDKSLEKARALGVRIHGVAIGSWLRKKILDLDLDAAKQLSMEVLKKSRSFSVQNQT